MSALAKTLAGATIHLLGGCLDAYAQTSAPVSSLTTQPFSSTFASGVTDPPSALPAFALIEETPIVTTPHPRDASERAQLQLDQYRKIQRKKQDEHNRAKRAAEATLRLQAQSASELQVREQGVGGFESQAYDVSRSDVDGSKRNGKKNTKPGSKNWGRVAPNGAINGGWDW